MPKLKGPRRIPPAGPLFSLIFDYPRSPQHRSTVAPHSTLSHSPHHTPHGQGARGEGCQCLNEKEDYFLAASDTDEEYGHMAFWGHHKQKLPKWHAVVMVVVLLQPSSAFMERVFSILRCCFDERQQSVYSDRICASALLKYNRGRAGGSTGLWEDRDGPKDGDGWL